MTLRAAMAFLLLAAPVLAEAPTTSLRPVARGAGPVSAPAAVADASPEAPGRSVRPRVRAGGGVSPETLGVRREVGERKKPTLLSLLRPKSRSRNVEENAKRVTGARRGRMICDDPAIQGLKVGRVAGTLKGCGVVDAVRVESVAGVSLSTHAVMDCRTAGALKSWVETGVRPAIGQRGGGVSELRVVAHYACRTRNSRKGARISEHGKGHAIDIAGFRLRDGTRITVLDGWSDRRDGKVLKSMWKSACGPFGTVLGPNSDRFHRDHFHLDTARYRSGSYCR